MIDFISSCHAQVKSGMEVLFCVEVESRFLSECSRDGTNGRAASRLLAGNALPASVARQNWRTAERCSQMGLYS